MATRAQTAKNTTGRKTKLVGVSELVDQSTGEIIPVQVTQIEQRDFNFHKVWLQNLVMGLDEISNQKLRLAFWIIDHLNKENQLIMTQQQISDSSGMSIKTVARTLKALQMGEKPFLVKLNNFGGAYMVNPDMIYKGSFKSRMAILYDYSKCVPAQTDDEDDDPDIEDENQQLPEQMTFSAAS